MQLNEIALITEELENQLENQLKKTSKDLIIDYSGITISNIFSSKIFEEVPIIKTIASVCDLGLALRERKFAKNLILFLNNYNSGSISNKDLSEFILKMEDYKFKSRVLDVVMISLDRFRHDEKVKMFSSLFISYINQEISWNKLIYFIDCLDFIFIEDIETLNIFYSNKESSFGEYQKETQQRLSSIKRLENLGFISSERSTIMAFGRAPVFCNYSILSDGVLFFKSINFNKF